MMTLLCRALVFAIVVCAHTNASAQTYPTKPIRLIVPYLLAPTEN